MDGTVDPCERSEDYSETFHSAYVILEDGTLRFAGTYADAQALMDQIQDIIRNPDAYEIVEHPLYNTEDGSWYFNADELTTMSQMIPIDEFDINTLSPEQRDMFIEYFEVNP